MKYCLSLILTLFLAWGAAAQKGNKGASEKSQTKTQFSSGQLSGMKLRPIGPALTSGRIADIAVNPDKTSEYYLAVASGGVWKTENAGTTFKPIFDGQGSYSIGCVTLDPTNPHTVWVGTGENNNQRSVAYGDGVYKSTDGGASWQNMGLKNSEHIGMILVHPEDPNTVYVAAYGPLWSPGGDRGIYKTTDGGKTWDRILFVSENTGFNEIHMDPRDPETLYATSHQRRRRVWTYIDGGPETVLYKSTDGGKNWHKSQKGLPTGDLGRIGMAISPVNPDVVYAIVNATEGAGFYRSRDRGASWHKMSDYHTSGNYYQEIFCAPDDVDKVYAMDTWFHHTEDGGKTFVKTGEKSKHVDNHAMWIDPDAPDHWLVGCDGGLYETWNAAGDWKYFANLPVTQFYKVAVDNDTPFYNVYGGTQDNNTQGGPSRTTSLHGIANSDWYITNGGDGFQPQVDPENPDIVYGQAQYGWLVRYDRKSGERVGIQPQPTAEDSAWRWNWDAPLIISPHDHKRLYFASNVVYRSDDRGNSWTEISHDLSRGIDRNELKVMGRVWGADAVMKNKSTSMYGNVTALDESPVQEGLLYAGTDDGLVHMSDNAGLSWGKMSSFPGVPDRTYVNELLASKHDAGTVYAAFNNHKSGDFKPYLLKSSDKGRTWTSIAGDLPKRGSVYSIAEDGENADLLFVGTEFGLFFTVDGGVHWSPLKSGLPTISVRDLAIQARENDLVLATFGRGFYVLDDYSPLRELSKSTFVGDAKVFEPRPALLYVEDNRLGGRGKSSQGEAYFEADNPPFGAVFTYVVNDSLKTRKAQRRAEEKRQRKAERDETYPTVAELRAEDRETEPYLLFVVRDDKGEAIRKIQAKPASGLQRVSWNLRHASTSPIKLKTKPLGRYSEPDEGMFVLPGTYTVEMHKFQDGAYSLLADKQPFEVKMLEKQSLPAQDRAGVLAFLEEVAELQRSMEGTEKLNKESHEKLDYIRMAVKAFPGAPLSLSAELDSLGDVLYNIDMAMHGDRTKSSRDMETLPGLTGRLAYVSYTTWWNTAEPTQTARDQYRIAKELYAPVLENSKAVARHLADLEKRLLDLKVPYTPGRSGDWKRR